MAVEALFPNDLAAPVERVLVVDDDADINRLLRARLAARKYQVEAAGDGEEALRVIEAFHPDLVFLDVSMPGMGGLEVLERVRAQGLDLAVIMTTAFGSEQVAIDALRRGADDYLRKPFEPREFSAVLERTATRLVLGRQNAALREQLDEKRRQLEQELARAAQVQADLLPRTAPELPGFEVAARCVPAREVGGDFFDWQQPAEGLLTITLGDAMGKGMPAALLMATVRAALRSVAGHNPPAAALEIASKALEGDLERSGSFMTLFHARLDVTTRRLLYVDAGHGLGLLLRASGAVEELKPGGLPLGMFPDQKYQIGSFRLDPGDVLLVFSDGLLDAGPEPGAGPDRGRLASLLQGGKSAADMVDRIFATALTSAPPPDDLTVLVLRCLPER